MVNIDDILEFDQLQERISRLIKVIGVGGAGTNAVNYMFENDTLQQAEYIVCNTDVQALKASPVPRKIQLGKGVTGGLGAGSEPSLGQKAVAESLDEIREILSENTKMVFVTAGMGGGTGTGAAPQIARVARELGLLTVGVVTMPFEYEGEHRMKQALKGLQEMKRHVDSLIVINNERLVEIYGDLGYKDAFDKSDHVLYNAVMSVINVIVYNYEINVDFNDVEAVLKNSGTALIATARAEGPNRAKDVVEKVLESPLLNNNKISGAKNLLVLVVSGKQQITVNEINKIHKMLQKQAQNPKAKVIFGLGDDPNLENQIAVTLIATGFTGQPAAANGEEDDSTVVVVATGSESGKGITIPIDDETGMEPDIDETESGEQEVIINVNLSNPTSETPADPVHSSVDVENDDFAREWELFEQEKQKEVPASQEPTGQTESQTEEPDKENPPKIIVVTNEEPDAAPYQPTLFDDLENDEKNSQTGTPEGLTTKTTVENTNKPGTEWTPGPGNTAGKQITPENKTETGSGSVSPISEYEKEMMKRFERLESLRSAQSPDLATGTKPASPPKQATPLRKDEIERLRNYNYRFSKNFSGPIVPPGGQKGNIVNLESENPRWDDDHSYLNQKFD